METSDPLMQTREMVWTTGKKPSTIQLIFLPFESCASIFRFGNTDSYTRKRATAKASCLIQLACVMGANIPSSQC